MQFSMLIYSLFLCCFNVGDPKSAMDLRFSFSVLFFRTQMQIFIDVNDSLHGKKSEKYFSRWEFSHFNFIFLLFYRKKSSWENKNFSIIIINCKNTSRRWDFLFYPYNFFWYLLMRQIITELWLYSCSIRRLHTFAMHFFGGKDFDFETFQQQVRIQNKKYLQKRRHFWHFYWQCEI